MKSDNWAPRSEKIKECCKNPSNLDVAIVKPDLHRYTCLVCGAKHLRLAAEAGLFGAAMKGLGNR